MNEKFPPQLQLILDTLPVEVEVSDEEYSEWKSHYEVLPEHEKVERLLNVLCQYLTSHDAAAATILASAVMCTRRWCNEKDWEIF